ncbi:cation channel sperm-associated auxiliary subunit TMEM249-like [Pocillopora verrucosa]|uniref:cation channel sperm-associated auxiliary subunit TMEM249-like n=1 Tax=Pocillopora verrucosa TaxID=203993 RepID=UPI00279795D9|nr:cation channel sperm-associated auxiliary subunit TMEM249-like [Pocillopora verrucosa]
MGFKKTLKALEILEKPEAIFNRRLQSNPYHPFNMVERNKFVLALSRKRFYIGTLTAFVSIVALITWGIAFEASQYMVFLILVGGVSAIMAWENRGHRTCVLDGERAQYVCVIGEHSVENGNFHNVYIRLKAQKHGAGEMYYYVVFNGFHLTEQKITSYSKNDKKLRVLAKRLAENLNLNYFDVKASSRDHVIRHRPVVDVPSVKNSKFNVEQPV